ncbi:unnamed protein product, partial [Gulo gulo]
RPRTYYLDAWQGDFASGPRGYRALAAAPHSPVTERPPNPPASTTPTVEIPPGILPIPLSLEAARSAESGFGGLLHLPGRLLNHHFVPIWVHLPFCLEEAKMPQLWGKLYLKGPTHPAFLQPAFSNVNVVYNSLI